MPNPSLKGANFERQIAKRFSLWLSNGEDKFLVMRRPGSGGSFRDKSGATKKGGDITSDNPKVDWFFDKICVELKFYKELQNPLWSYLTGKSSIIDKFLEQAIEAAKVDNKFWMLIVKTNFKDALLFTNNNSFDSKLFWKRDGIFFGSLEHLFVMPPDLIRRTF